MEDRTAPLLRSCWLLALAGARNRATTTFFNDCDDATQWSEAWRYAKRGSGWKPAAASVIIFRICWMHLSGSSRTCSPSPGSQAQLSCCSPFRHASTKSSRLYGKIAIQQKKSRESTIRRENVLPAFLPRNRDLAAIFRRMLHQVEQAENIRSTPATGFF